MSYIDPFRINDALSSIRDEMERWDRITRTSAIDSALTAGQALSQQIESLSGRSVSRQIAEVAAAGPRVYEDLATRVDVLTATAREALVAGATVTLPRVCEDLNATTKMLAGLGNPMADLEHELTRTSAMIASAQRLDSGSSLDRMIRAALADIDWKGLHGSFDFSDQLARVTSNLMDSYEALSLQAPPETLFTLDTFPAIELYAHAGLVGGLGRFDASAPAEAEEEETEKTKFRKEIDEGSQVTLESLLAHYDSDLRELWIAANEALTNEYYAVLKFCSAQRELLRKILQKAAPNDVVQQWITDPAYISPREGHVTMRGRIAFVCDKARRSGYTHFAITDAKAAAEVWKLLNRGAHEVPSRLAPCQAAELRIRSNCLILMTLQLIIEGANGV